MSPIEIKTTTMGFSVPINSRGTILGSSLPINDFSRYLCHWQYDQLTAQWKLLNEYFYFDKENERCYFPKYELERFKEYLNSNRTPFVIKEVPPVEGKEVNFHMLPWVDYKNEKQRGAVEYLTNPESGPVRGLALQMGVGKTVSAIWSVQKIGRRSLLSMTSRLEQWVSEICKYTNLEEDDCYVVQGVGSLTKLFNQIDKEIHPKFILASTRTMRLYVDYGPTYQHLPHPSEACEKLGVGIVAGDESHESFVSSYLMTLLFNPKIFIPITATFASNDPFVKNIFNHVYPKEIQFNGGGWDRYVEATSYRYTGGGYLIKPYNYTTRKMYSQIKFEDFLLSKKGENVWKPFVKDALIPIIKEQYINVHEKGEKLLILCATTAMAEEIANIVKRYFPDKTASPFYSGMPVTILEKYDVIVSTPGSAGCLSGDTVVSISRNGTNSKAGSYLCTLKNAYSHFNGIGNKRQHNWDGEVPTYIRSYNGKSIQLGQVGDILYSGIKDVFKITLANGFSLKCTADHPIMTTVGWVQAKDIVGKNVMCEVSRCAKKKNGRKKLHAEHSKLNFNQDVPDYSEAVSIEYIGEEDTYDIHCLDENHNFVANGIVVHNTGRDIKGLRSCIVFDNTKSEIRNLQYFGRLRGPPTMLNVPYFSWIYFGCIEKHVQYNQARNLLYGPVAKTIKHRSL